MGTPDMAEKQFSAWTTMELDGITIVTKEVSTVVKAGGYECTATRAQIKAPLKQVRWRLDTAIKLSEGIKEKDLTIFPHGLIGQSFDNDQLAVSGKTDVSHKD